MPGRSKRGLKVKRIKTAALEVFDVDQEDLEILKRLTPGEKVAM